MDAINWIETHFDVRPVRGDWVSANCPFCSETGKSPDHKFHLGINVERNMAHCFRCGYKKSFIALVMQTEQCSFAEAHEILGKRITSNKLTLKEFRTTKQLQEVELPAEYRELNPKNPRHAGPIQYLKGRGISLQVAKHLKFGYAVTGEYAQRVIIPVIFDRKVVGFTARTILPKSEEPLRYKTSENFQVSKYLYNYDTAKNSDTVVLMEGPLDVVKLPEMAVGVFTNRLSDAQAYLLALTWKEVIIMLDRDAREESWDIYKRLKNLVPCSVVALQKHKDPGTATVVDIAAAIAKRQRGITL